MNRHSQQGLTTIGWIVVIAIFGSIVLTGFKILPMYIQFFNVKAAMAAVAQNTEIDDRSKRDLWIAINNNLRIQSVRDLKKEDFSFVREDGVTTMTVNYEVRKPYIAQLFIGANFTHSIEIQR